MKIVRHHDPKVMAQALAKKLEEFLRERTDGVVAFPGGNSPLLFFDELSKINLPWDHTMVTTTDERCVPMESEDSNIGQVLRVIGPVPNFLPLWKNGVIIEKMPALSACFLGVGLDGHFASLFPCQPWKPEKGPYAVVAPKPPANRVTLPAHIILHSPLLVLLVSGADKVRFCEEILAGMHFDAPVFRLIQEAPHLEIHMAS